MLNGMLFLISMLPDEDEDDCDYMTTVMAMIVVIHTAAFPWHVDADIRHQTSSSESWLGWSAHHLMHDAVICPARLRAAGSDGASGLRALLLWGGAEMRI